MQPTDHAKQQHCQRGHTSRVLLLQACWQPLLPQPRPSIQCDAEGVFDAVVKAVSGPRATQQQSSMGRQSTRTPQPQRPHRHKLMPGAPLCNGQHTQRVPCHTVRPPARCNRAGCGWQLPLGNRLQDCWVHTATLGHRQLLPPGSCVLPDALPHNTTSVQASTMQATVDNLANQMTHCHARCC